jgi:putative phage-type endonuclease
MKTQTYTREDLIKNLPDCSLFSTDTKEINEDAWLLSRSLGIGGSDIGSICGVNPFATARQVYLSKTGQYTPEFSNGAIERMHFGTILEPIVTSEYMRRTGKKVVPLNAILKNNKHPWALANVDGIILNEEGIPEGILECKTAGEYSVADWEEGDVMQSYIYQLNWYLFVTGLKWGAIACIVGGNKFYSYEIYRNDSLIDTTLLPKADHFWNENVKKLIEPDVTASDNELLAELFSTSDKGAEVSLAEDLYDDLARTVFECKAKIKELKRIEDEATAKIKDVLREAEIGYCNSYLVTWKQQTQTRVDTSVLKTMYPNVYADVCHTINIRKFLVKEL